MNIFMKIYPRKIPTLYTIFELYGYKYKIINEINDRWILMDLMDENESVITCGKSWLLEKWQSKKLNEN
jgi:hypothetical protein